MWDARGYFIRHIFKKIMRFNLLKKYVGLFIVKIWFQGGLNYNRKTAKIQERFFFEDEMVDFKNFLIHP
jgi:hypothetical protein